MAATQPPHRVVGAGPEYERILLYLVKLTVITSAAAPVTIRYLKSEKYPEYILKHEKPEKLLSINYAL